MDFQPKAESKMKESLAKFKNELGGMRTGRANPQILDSVKVEYYGQPVPLKQVAAISIPEARVLEIRPWDPAMLAEIEKAIQKSDVGIAPQNDGKALRLNLPTMTEERRKEMVKVLGRMGEDCRVAVRNDRRDAIEEIKKAGKDKKLSEDQQKTQEAAIQKLTDAYVKKVDEAVAEKQKEISTL